MTDAAPRPAPGRPAARSDVQAAEAWFVAHGLPYFVDDVRARVHAGLRRAAWPAWPWSRP